MVPLSLAPRTNRLAPRSTAFGGFTLVELLVVIGIIALLVAISAGSYTSVMVHARKSACASNLRAIGVGLLQFASEHNQILPESGSIIPHGTTDPVTKMPGWTEQLEPYLGASTDTVSNSIYRCPETSKTMASNSQYSYFVGAHAAYSEAQTASGVGSFGPVYLLKVASLSTLVLAGDIAFNTFVPNDADKDDYTADPAFGGGTAATPRTIAIHGGYSNLVFGDGHVESLKYFDKSSASTTYLGPGHSYLFPPEQ